MQVPCSSLHAAQICGEFAHLPSLATTYLSHSTNLCIDWYTARSSRILLCHAPTSRSVYVSRLIYSLIANIIDFVLYLRCATVPPCWFEGVLFSNPCASAIQQGDDRQCDLRGGEI